MRIVLDAMGSDSNPDPEVNAAVQAAEIYGDELILIGNEKKIIPKLKSLNGSNLIHFVHAPDTITMDDKGLNLALKAKRKNANNSMAVGIDFIKNGEADAFVTAGNTGGALTTAYLRLGTIEGVDRPALCVVVPVYNSHCVTLDIGANPECKPIHLLQFAYMGATYAESVLGIEKPKIGLLSNGEEAGKGNELVKQTYPLIENSSLNFIGNVESKEVYAGQVDVLIMDGFTGNVFIKTSEAVANMLLKVIKEELTSSLRTSLGALLAKPAFDTVRKMLDPREVGAAPLLGINGLVFIGHGRSDTRAILSSIKAARKAVAGDLLSSLKTALQENL